MPAARVLAALVMAGVLALPSTPAGAHPSDQVFQVNQYAGLTFAPDRVGVVAVLNTAELVTQQDRRSVDADHDGTVTGAERARHRDAACQRLAAEFDVNVDGARLTWTVTSGDYRYEDTASGLPHARLTCQLSAPTRLSGPATVTIANRHRLDQPGWRELTANGDGVRLVDSRVPRSSVSDELRAIPPADALVLDVRTATVRVEPGADEPAADQLAPPPAGTPDAAVNLSWAQHRFEGLARGPLTPLLAVAVVLLAVLLGAGHAALPGHGKTVLAAYLAGRRGRKRDALAIGAIVTASHTGAVLVVGAVLSTSTAFAGDRLLRLLGIASGLLIVAVGAGMLVATVRHRAAHQHGDHHHHHRPAGRLGLAGIGVAGGLVPSPSALVVLLASVGTGRALLGVLLVLAYGLGMAGTLTAAGLLLLAVQRRVEVARTRPARLLARVRAAAPSAWPLTTAAVVLIVGAGLAVRAGFA